MTVMVRPMSGVHALAEAMQRMLERRVRRRLLNPAYLFFFAFSFACRTSIV